MYRRPASRISSNRRRICHLQTVKGSERETFLHCLDFETAYKGNGIQMYWQNVFLQPFFFLFQAKKNDFHANKEKERHLFRCFLVT